MMVIGITGPTGAGKTTFLNEVAKLGGAVIDCDAVYHEMLRSDLTLQDRLENAFGPLRDSTGCVDRKKLGAIVFRDPSKLSKLNNITQNAVVFQTQKLIETYQKQGNDVIAIDAIALLESPLKELCRLTVAVLAPPEMRVNRIMMREGISVDYAGARVRAQKPDEYFSKNCNITLRNDCANAEEFAQRVHQYLQQIIQKEAIL